MKKISVLKNTIQEYAWGSRTAIPGILGTRASDRPQAELWMGAHPKAPSMVRMADTWTSLTDVIQAAPETVLGEAVSKKFNHQLPYLFKILAAAVPLSIQAHPDKEQARAGYAREDQLEIPQDASERNYRDENHKPECLCAITPFWALSGFRQVSDIISLVSRTCRVGLAEAVKRLSQDPDASGLERFFFSLMHLNPHQKSRIIKEALDSARMLSDESPVFKWIIKLGKTYPEDIGILSPLFLNLTCLEPGQAIFLPSGQLHSYLDGVGMELMANSDNVLRGGLTPKHMDVPELIRILSFEPRTPDILFPEKANAWEWAYPVHAEEFALSMIRMEGGAEAFFTTESVQILLCMAGQVMINAEDHSVEVKKGDAVIIPAAVRGYRMRGEGTLYKASVPIR